MDRIFEIFLIYHVCAGIAGLVLNVLTVAVLVTGSKVDKGIKYQLISLAIANILSSIFLPLTYYSASVKNIFWNVHGCRAVSFLGEGCLYVSLYCTAAISLERVVITYHPLEALQYSTRKKQAVTVSVWLLGLLSYIEAIFDQDVVGVYDGNCSIIFPFMVSKKWKLLLYRTLWIIRFVVPVIIIVVCYFLIALRVCGGTETSQQEAVDDQRSESTSRTKILRMLTAAAGVTVATWLPYLITSLLAMRDPLYIMSLEVRRTIILVAWGLLASNLFTSPVIYFMANGAFRVDTKAMFSSLISRCKSMSPSSGRRGLLHAETIHTTSC